MKKTIRLVAILACFIFVFACKGNQIGGAIPPGDGDLGPTKTLSDYKYPDEFFDCELAEEDCDIAECVGEDCDADDPSTARRHLPRPARPAYPAPLGPVRRAVSLDPVVEKAVRDQLEDTDGAI